MNSLKNSLRMVTFGSIILDVLFIVLSIFLIANPSAGISSAVLLFGIALVISGVYSIIKYIMNENFFFKFELVYGVVSIIIGLISIFKPLDVMSFITTIVGLWLIVTSAFKLVLALNLRRFKEDTWTFDLSIAIMTIILGILLLINPFQGYIVLSTYAAILVMVYSATDIVEQVFIIKRASRIVKLLSK